MRDREFSELPAKFIQTMTEAHGRRGALWLAELPGIVGEIKKQWLLQVGSPFPNLSYHFVAPCVCADGGEAVLKIGFPENDSPIFNEAEMLKTYDGHGAVKLLRIDAERYALLLEKLAPGEHLKTVFQNNDVKAVQTAVEVLLKIKRKPPPRHNFVRLENWFAGFEKARNTNFPAPPLEKARNFYDALTTSSEKFLLHGDFHHENILSAGRDSFLAIDPKGIVGEIGYEIAVFLNNHRGWLSPAPDAREKLNDAVSVFADVFDAEPRALRKWAYAQAVLSAWWTFEENGKNWEKELAFAEIWEV